MKKIYGMMSLILLCAGQLMAQPLSTVSGTATDPSAVDFISNAVKSAEGDTAFNLNGQKLGAVFVPLRTVDLPVVNAFDAGAGAVFGAGTPEGLVSFRMNLPQLANGLFGTAWFTKNSRGLTLPTLFIGPAVKAEWPIKKWTWKQDIYFLVGIPFGSVFK